MTADPGDETVSTCARPDGVKDRVVIIDAQNQSLPIYMRCWGEVNVGPSVTPPGWKQFGADNSGMIGLAVVCADWDGSTEAAVTLTKEQALQLAEFLKAAAEEASS